MDTLQAVALVLMVTSVSFNVFLYLSLKRSRKQPRPNATAEQVISDLLSGSALVRLERIAPADVFLRRR